MVKNIIKELIIILLLALAIILLLGVILYNYVPANKIIPEKISYLPSDSIKEELDNNMDDSFYEEPQTYKIESEDLNNYKKIQEYVPGKKNPFESITNTETNNTVTNSNTTNQTTQSSNVNGTTQNLESNNTNEATQNAQTNTNENTGYIPDKGTK